MNDPNTQGNFFQKTTAAATISADGFYRYNLTRLWDPALPRVLFCMINPSTADAFDTDPTITKCIGFAKRWGMGALEVVNLFAWRSSDVRDLARTADPIGPENDAAILEAIGRARLVVVAWGPKPRIEQRATAVLALFAPRIDVHCIALAKNGQPCHPLMLPYASPLMLFRRKEP